MAKLTINIGTTPNDGTGDTLRDAFDKVNDNFDELYTVANTTAIFIGNSTVNTLANSTIVTLANSTSTANLTSATLTIGTSVVNSSSLALGSNVILSTTTITIGNSTVNTIANSTFIKIANSTVSSNLTPNSLTVGPTVVNNSMIIVGSNVSINSSAIFTGNSTVNLTINSSSLTIPSGLNYVNSSANIAIFASNGNIGIANVVPTYKLTVQGDAYISTNTLSLGTSTNAANGYTFLPNGFKLVWGWVSANSTDGNASFTSAFTTNAYSVTATSNTADATYQAAVIGTNNTVALIRTANATSTNVFFMAVGT